MAVVNHKHITSRSSYKCRKAVFLAKRCEKEILMKNIGLLLILLVFCISNGYSQPSLEEIMERQRKESIDFNASVTDEEIIDFLEFQYEIDIDMLNQLRDIQNNPEKKEIFLENYRGSYNHAGMRIPTLKGFSEKEIGQYE